MNIGICNLSIVALRASDSHRSEMVSQVLFAEQFKILRSKNDWVYVRLIDTEYEGWIQQGQFITLPNDYSIGMPGNPYKVVDVIGATAIFDRSRVNLLPGTKIFASLLSEYYSEFPYTIIGSLREPVKDDFSQEFPKLMDYYSNSPYLWGGRSHLGIDCSGLSQAIYAHFGIPLPRDAYQQADKGGVVNFFSEIKAGDLAFFDNEDRKITHVGVVIDHETIFHASAHVRIDRLDSQGIFNRQLNRYTHQLRIVKRFW